MGPTSEKEFLRSVPPVRMTSTAVPASSAAMLTALVMMVRFWKLRRARAMAVVVVPESRIRTWPSFTFSTAASAMRIFS